MCFPQNRHSLHTRRNRHCPCRSQPKQDLRAHERPRSHRLPHLDLNRQSRTSCYSCGTRSSQINRLHQYQYHGNPRLQLRRNHCLSHQAPLAFPALSRSHHHRSPGSDTSHRDRHLGLQRVDPTSSHSTLLHQAGHHHLSPRCPGQCRSNGTLSSQLCHLHPSLSIRSPHHFPHRSHCPSHLESLGLLEQN